MLPLSREATVAALRERKELRGAFPDGHLTERKRSTARRV
jgi:hypothetical protein